MFIPVTYAQLVDKVFLIFESWEELIVAYQIMNREALF